MLSLVENMCAIIDSANDTPSFCPWYTIYPNMESCSDSRSILVSSRRRAATG